jgi:hypothetical protein
MKWVILKETTVMEIYTARDDIWKKHYRATVKARTTRDGVIWTFKEEEDSVAVGQGWNWNEEEQKYIDPNAPIEPPPP